MPSVSLWGILQRSHSGATLLTWAQIPASRCKVERQLQLKKILAGPSGKKCKKQVRGMVGRGGGLVDRSANSGPYNLSLIPIGEKKENKRKRGLGWPIY